MTLLTVVDEARIDQFYVEIEQMVVSLDEEFSHQAFNRKSVLIRTYMDRIGTITSQLTGDLHRVSRQLLKLEKLLEVEQNSLLASDMNVRSERTHAAQLAKVAHLLKDKIQEINLLTVQKEDLERMMGLIKVKLQDLHNAQSALRDQRKVFELIHANGKGLPAVTEYSTRMGTDLDAMLATMAAPVSTLAPVEGFLEPPDDGGVPRGASSRSETDNNPEPDLDSILSTIPSLAELTSKRKIP